jgi:prepilin-type N-terminal cleavage/methylation domain-containing protein
MQKGFTLIELMIVIAIIGIVASIFVPLLAGKSSKWTPAGGWTEETCMGGYKFVQARNAVTQILDAQGHGVPCN